jgi:cellobiose-specific phosphotransferase system component IIB
VIRLACSPASGTLSSLLARKRVKAADSTDKNVTFIRKCVCRFTFDHPCNPDVVTPGALLASATRGYAAR